MSNKGTWKITVAGSAFADYTDILQPEGIGGGKTWMEVVGYGATAKLFIDMGNLAIVRKFTMTRQHSTDTLAHAWYQTAIATWVQVATVVLTHLDYSGEETTFTIAGAKFELEVETPIGTATTTKITITGPAST